MSWFTVAAPIERSEFRRLYKNVLVLTKLLLAPCGLDDQIEDLVGQQKFVEIYSPIYQQLEDIVAKWAFRFYGYDDDRVIASMHQYISQEKDEKVCLLRSISLFRMLAITQ